MAAALLPKYVDPVLYAERGVALSGSLAVSNLERLHDMLWDRDGSMQIDLQFGRDDQNICYIQGKVVGILHLCCQRCLQKMDFPVDITLCLAPVTTLDAEKRLPQRYEPLFMEEERVIITSLIEEELLLQIPIAPKHEEGLCVASG